MDNKLLVGDEKIGITIKRLCLEIIENFGNFENCVLVGIQPRGAQFADRLFAELKQMAPDFNGRYGHLDVTFFRDDFRRNNTILNPFESTLPFEIEDKDVLLIDDVLWTGRTIRAAMDALLSYGRPARVELMVLVDRRYSRDLPIEPNYTGYSVDSLTHQKVKVRWNAPGGNSIELMAEE